LGKLQTLAAIDAEVNSERLKLETAGNIFYRQPLVALSDSSDYSHSIGH
jgi:hypothetical protein